MYIGIYTESAQEFYQVSEPESGLVDLVDQKGLITVDY